MDSQTTSLIVIAVYLLFLVTLGAAAKKLVSNTSDYFRSGSRGTWWLAGSSIFMGNFSAWTFTGAAAMAFDAGWAILAIYLFHPIVALLQACFVAHRFRQLRATTAPEVIRMRFGPVTQQFYAVLQVLAQFLSSSIALYGLSIFISAFFGIKVSVAILVLGTVVLIYSTAGGSWAVMAADYVQSLLVVGIVAITAALSLWHLGGYSGMIEKIAAAGLTEQFRFFKASGEFPLDKFTPAWVAALGVMYLFETVSLSHSVRYFSVKDGREARKAAWLLMVLSITGVLFWFLPPIAGRLLFPDEVLKASLDRPMEGAFAVTSLRLLPGGMAGLLAIAIISTTLSTMDSGLNRNAAIIVREIWPALLRLLGRQPALSEERQLALSRIVSLAAGVAVILVALFYAGRKSLGIFDIMQIFTSMVALPMTIPMGLALLLRKAPSWAALASVGCGFAVSLCSFVSGTVFDHPWTFHATTFGVTVAGIAGYLVSMLFWRYSPSEYRNRVDHFFCLMETPVDFSREVGQANDARQLRLLGTFTLIAGFLSALLLFTVHNLRDAGLVLLFCFFLTGIGGLMMLAARRR